MEKEQVEVFFVFLGVGGGGWNKVSSSSNYFSLVCVCTNLHIFVDIYMHTFII